MINKEPRNMIISQGNEKQMGINLTMMMLEFSEKGFTAAFITVVYEVNKNTI